MQRPIESYFYTWATSDAARAAGFVALVIAETKNVSMGYFNSGIPPGASFPWPIVGMDEDTRDVVLAWNGSIEWAVLDSDSLLTPWYLVRTSGYFWFLSVSMCFLSAALAVLGIGRLIQFHRALGSWKLNVINGVISLEVFGAALRVVYWSVDPIGQRGIWSDPARDVWHTVSFPFGISATLLLVSYWYETTSRTSLKFSWSIDRLRVPSYILLAGVFLVELIIDILVLCRVPVRALPLINSVIYLIIVLGLSIFFFITAGKVLYQLLRLVKLKEMVSSQASVGGSSSSRSSRRMSKLRFLFPVAVKMILTAFCWLVIVCTGFVATTDEFSSVVPSYFCSVWFIIHFLLNLKGLSTVLALRAPKSSQSTTQGSKTSTSQSSHSAQDASLSL
jgi:hypothetical protein